MKRSFILLPFFAMTFFAKPQEKWTDLVGKIEKAIKKVSPMDITWRGKKGKANVALKDWLTEMAKEADSVSADIAKLKEQQQELAQKKRELSILKKQFQDQGITNKNLQKEIVSLKKQEGDLQKKLTSLESSQKNLGEIAKNVFNLAQKEDVYEEAVEDFEDVVQERIQLGQKALTLSEKLDNVQSDAARYSVPLSGSTPPPPPPPPPPPGAVGTMAFAPPPPPPPPPNWTPKQKADVEEGIKHQFASVQEQIRALRKDTEENDERATKIEQKIAMAKKETANQRDQLMASIRAGKKLRPTGQDLDKPVNILKEEAENSDAHSQLLKQLRAGIKLRPVQQNLAARANDLSEGKKPQTQQEQMYQQLREKMAKINAVLQEPDCEEMTTQKDCEDPEKVTGCVWTDGKCVDDDEEW